MQDLPNDIRREIARTFKTETEQQHVAEKLRSLYLMSLNVGPQQLARCVLVMADGNVKTLNGLFENGFGGDPRDLIMAATDTRSGMHYGLAPFTQADP